MTPNTRLDSVEWDHIPELLRQPLKLYVKYGKVPGPFLTALLASDGHEIIMRCPSVLSIDDLRRFVVFCDSQLPRQCFGTPEAVAQWEDAHGLAGLVRIAETG
jgi:hypothetical protein